MRKIYVITNGYYSDYHIIAATTSEKAAKKIAARFDANIEEYNDDGEKLLDQNMYHFKFSENGVLIHEDVQEVGEYDFCKNEPCIYMNHKNEHIDVFINSVSRDKAFKIACDERAKFLAEKEGL